MRKVVVIAAYSLLLVSAVSIYPFSTTPFYSPRSQGEDTARWLAGWTHQVNLWDAPCRYGVFAITPEISQSFNAVNITDCLFGNDLFFDDCRCPVIKISGSQVPCRSTTKEWLADYFGLPTDFQSTVGFNPKVTTFLIDFNMYYADNTLIDGLYFNVFCPLVYTSWFLDMKERVKSKGVLGYNAGYFTPSAVPREDLLNNFTEFISLQKTATLPDNITMCPLSRAIISPKPLHKVGFADIQAAVGINFLSDEDYHLGLNARIVIPTGTIPKGKFLFEPIIGNGGFFEFGGGLSTHGIIWRNEACDKEWGFYIEAWITHMFDTIQTRSFDLRGADNSRYMLAELMTDDVKDDLKGEGVLADAQFNNLFTPIANISTIPVKVSVLWHQDVTLMLNFSSCGHEFDFGYNYWSRSPESVSFVDDESCRYVIDNRIFGVKGDAQMFGFNMSTNAAVALSATQSAATITGGLNFPDNALIVNPPNVIVFDGNLNKRIDNPKLAFSDMTELLPSVGSPAQINTSLQPVLITTSDLSPCRSSTHGFSHTIFMHWNYTWPCEDTCWYAPYFGVGIKAELSPEGPENNCPTLCTSNVLSGPSPCGTCDDETLLHCGLSQWGIWFKGGLSFH